MKLLALMQKLGMGFEEDLFTVFGDDNRGRLIRFCHVVGWEVSAGSYFATIDELLNKLGMVCLGLAMICKVLPLEQSSLA